MSRSAKTVTLLLWIVAVAAMVSVVAMQWWGRDRGSAQAFSIFAPTFTLTDQLGRSVTTDDLKGRPWVADFIFTQCASACPLMTRRLASVQTTISPQVRFVSFSVDPDHDTPPVLLAYAKQYGADLDRWLFLTGPKDQLFSAIQGMKVSLIPATDGNPIEHDVHYLLMDSAGRLRGAYDSRVPGEVDRLVSDANALAAGQESKP